MNIAQRNFDYSPDILNRNGLLHTDKASSSEQGRSPLPGRTNAFYLRSISSMIPHPTKVDKGGEDAFFISSDRKAVGVADGVGGWGLHGIDPAIYAKSMMKDSRLAYEELGHKLPLDMLNYAYERAKTIQGSSTACVLVLKGKTLLTNNVGDSGFMIIRDNKIFYRFKEQLHSFNYPFQLGTASTNVPSDAVDVSFEVQEGDIIILGSDGLFDNLFDSEILDIVNTSSMESVADVLCRTAYMKSQSVNLETPFRKSACELGLVDSPLGGKLDDITIVVSRVSKD